MQLFFVKATYTNNVYKLSDFFLTGDYKQDATKMLDINFRPDDGLSSFITSKLTLPDGSSIRENTHIIIPEYEKIYRMVSIDYLNNDQYSITLDEDPLLGSYLDLESEDIYLTRSNDHSLFRGINDVANTSFKETIETKSIASDHNTGAWALLFFQYNPDDTVLGLKFAESYEGKTIYTGTTANILALYPEVSTNEPELYEYFQKIVYNSTLSIYQQCSYYSGALIWVVLSGIPFEEFYFKVDSSNVKPAKINGTDVMTICIGLPFDTSLESNDGKPLLSYEKFLGPVDTSLIDIKIINDLFIPIFATVDVLTYPGSPSFPSLDRKLVFNTNAGEFHATYKESTTATITAYKVANIFDFYSEVDISSDYNTSLSPLNAEPFYKYDLYVYGRRFDIPYYLTDDVGILLAVNSGVINYTIYYKEKRNMLASGSFTHSIRYQIDQLDAFYSQNPTYKEQFFTKMATDSIKTVAGGAISGAMVGGPAGAMAGAGAGLVGAGVDAGISMLNLHYQEKGLRLKPDQLFGENSEVSLQVLNIFGIYWVKSIPENIDQMVREYSLKGFPLLQYKSIDDLDFEYDAIYGTTKVVFGELKKVIKNEYITAFINEKLKQGVILIP